MLHQRRTQTTTRITTTTTCQESHTTTAKPCQEGQTFTTTYQEGYTPTTTACQESLSTTKNTFQRSHLASSMAVLGEKRKHYFLGTKDLTSLYYLLTLCETVLFGKANKDLQCIADGFIRCEKSFQVSVPLKDPVFCTFPGTSQFSNFICCNEPAFKLSDT